jgi:hypothetical protein
MDPHLLTLLSGALLASVLHAAIPTHWLPFILMGRARRWSRPRLLIVTAAAGTCHVITTILLGLGLIEISKLLAGSSEEILSRVASGVLLGAGLLFIGLQFVRRGHHHHHFPIAAEDDHPHGTREHVKDHGHRLAEGATIGTLIAVMTISPCEAILPMFPQVALHGWKGLSALAAVFLGGTVSGMLVLVSVGHRGAELIKSEFIEHNERLILGLILTILGIAGLALWH